MQRLNAAVAIVTTWAAVLAELTGSSQGNGKHIGLLLSDHGGTCFVAMNTFLGTVRDAEAVVQAVGLTGTPPIPSILD